MCEQLAQGHYLTVEWPGVSLTHACRVASQHLNHYNTGRRSNGTHV